MEDQSTTTGKIPIWSKVVQNGDSLNKVQVYFDLIIMAGPPTSPINKALFTIGFQYSGLIKSLFLGGGRLTGILWDQSMAYIYLVGPQLCNSG